MVEKFRNLFFSALPLFGAVAGIALFYALVHVVLSPLMRPVDASAFYAVRAPVVEEAFKYFVLWKIFNSKLKKINLLKIGFGMGLAETIINLYVVYEEMMIDINSSFSDFDAFELNFLITTAFIFKFIFTGTMQTFIMFAGIKLAGNRILSAFFVSVFIHWATNWMILSTIP